MDLMKLMMSNYDVEMIGDGNYEFEVMFKGPEDTPYAGGTWRVHVELPVSYPFKSPSIGFRNRMFHPNVDERSGSVCLDVINQTWSPMFDLINVFDMFLPQLLRYPNPDDPLNGEAAALMLREPDKYNARVKEHVKKYAMRGASEKEKEAAAGCGAKFEHDSGPPPRKGSDSSDASDASGGDSSMATTSGDEDDDELDDDDDDNASILSDISELSDD